MEAPNTARVEPGNREEEIQFLRSEMDRWNELVRKIRVPMAMRMMSQGGWLLLETCLYLLSLAFFALAWFSPKIYPFYLLEEFLTAREYLPLGRTTAEDLQLAQILLFILIGLILFLLARMVRLVRAKNAQIHHLAQEARELSLRIQKRLAQISEEPQASDRDELPAPLPPPPPGDQYF